MKREPSRAEKFLKGKKLLGGAQKSLLVNSKVQSVSKIGIHREIRFADGSIRRVTKRRLKTIMDQELQRKYGS